MGLYSYDIGKQIVEVLPPDKRYNNNISLLKGLTSPLQWLVDLIFKSYYEGSQAPNYAAGTYNYQDEVIYKKAVYSSLINNNTDIPTTSNWIKVLDLFVGVHERSLYNGAKITLEYALNKYYGGVFRQPQSPEGITDTKSDIYLENGTVNFNIFLIGKTTASTIGATTSSGFISQSLVISPNSYNFVVNIPASIYSTTNDQEISNFINRFIPFSLRFQINVI